MAKSEQEVRAGLEPAGGAGTALGLDHLLDAIPLGVLVTRNDELVYCNRTVCHIFGLSLPQVRQEEAWARKLMQDWSRVKNQEFIHSPHHIYKRVVYEKDNLTLLILLEITSLEYLDQFFVSVDFAEEILRYIFLNPYEGLNVVDSEGIIRYMSPPHEEFFGLKRGEAIGTHVTKVIENTRLHIVAKTGKAEVGKTQEMRNAERIVARIPIRKNGRIVGALGKVMFRDLDQLKDISQRINALKNEVDYYKKELVNLRQATFSLQHLVGQSPAFVQMKREIIKAAQVDISVLIIGETGTGKELVAHAIHNLSQRSRNPLITINCAAIPTELFESELFGFTPGAFTSAASKGKAGKFELAHGSSIFLDEIGELPFEVQSKLLRVLQEGYVEKIGSQKPLRSDFRIISATNKDIETLPDNNRFRRDLFYRINALTIKVPPLRDRPQDIPLLAEHFIEQFNQKYNRNIQGVSDEVIQAFTAYAWPGNVRELQNEIGRACSFASHDRLVLEDFHGHLKNLLARRARVRPTLDRKETLHSVEKGLIVEALQKTGGNKAQAAQLLGISRPLLYKKIKLFSITMPGD
ncbi:MAG: sigma 54-interacting transcriptional regulator [Thermodesulfobacteriota bacterium]